MRSDAHPVRTVTLNQVVAWNMALYRRAAGIGQRELGERLGWPERKVSEAERSWNGRRTREFNAEEIAGLALALGVPFAALLLPPDDDGRGVVYEMQPPGAKEPLPMAGLLDRVVMHDFPGDAPALEAYRRRFLHQRGKYLDPGRAAEGDEWFTPLDEEAVRAERAARLRARARTLMEYAEDDFDRAAALDPEGAEEEVGQ